MCVSPPQVREMIDRLSLAAANAPPRFDPSKINAALGKMSSSEGLMALPPIFSKYGRVCR